MERENIRIVRGPLGTRILKVRLPATQVIRKLKKGKKNLIPLRRITKEKEQSAAEWHVFSEGAAARVKDLSRRKKPPAQETPLKEKPNREKDGRPEKAQKNRVQSPHPRRTGWPALFERSK